MDKLIIPLLIISCLTNFTYSRPSKAHDQLDQQGTELEWEAWLLVQDTSRSSKADDLKRITPKSIFTVRPFSPDMLPACAEGYRSDAMGRCVKFIKIDQTSHLGFLVEKLNTMYVEEDYVDEVDGGEEPQPLQFNIPFGETSETSETMDTSETSKFLPNLTDSTVITKEMLTNFTNTSILSLFDELLSDEPVVVVVNETETDNKTLPTRATNQIDSSSQKSETVIIFFQPLKNNNTNNITSIDEEDQLINETVNVVNVTKLAKPAKPVKEVIAVHVDKLLQNNTLLHQIDDYVQINDSVNGTVAEAEETIEPSGKEIQYFYTFFFI